jgi:hypothetical protein
MQQLSRGLEIKETGVEAAQTLEMLHLTMLFAPGV